jgi:nucleoside-diphosphate-sugar epimerase
MLGRELQKYLQSSNFYEVFYVDKDAFDLTSEEQVGKMFRTVQPQRVIHLAARVGGIFDNMKYPVEYIEENVLINTLVTRWAYQFDVPRFTGIISACCYPERVDTYPMGEELLLEGTPEKTNINYAYSKRLQALQIDAYRNQHEMQWNYLIPSNLYGADDKDIDALHFIPALVKKIQTAVARGEDTITLFGDGTPIRQFMHVRDLSRIITEMVRKDITDSFNVACPDNLTIANMAEITMEAMNVKLNIIWDKDKPNGQHRRDLSLERFRRYFPHFEFTTLAEGVQEMCND